MERNDDIEAPMVPPTQIAPAPIPPSSATPAVDNKNNSGSIIAITIACIIAVCGIGFGVYGILQKTQKDKEILTLQAQINNLNEQMKDTQSANGESLISNTTWTTRDGSEVVFSEDRINWYRNPEDRSDNYYSGVYKFYIGKEAVEYITNDLSEYGITEDELSSLFDRNVDYSEDNIVVFDIRYDKYLINGEEQEITKPLVPWYGFILDDNTYLDVANMNTGTYYGFSKK